MAFLTLGGVLYEIQHSSAHQNESSYSGEKTRAFAGNMRSGRRAEKRAWTFTLIPLSQTDEAALRVALGTDTPLVANGDFNGGSAVTVLASISGSDFLPSGASFVRVVTVLLEEV